MAQRGIQQRACIHTTRYSAATARRWRSCRDRLAGRGHVSAMRISECERKPVPLYGNPTFGPPFARSVTERRATGMRR